MIPNTTHISSLMTHSPITVRRKAKLEEVRKIFKSNNIHHVPVVNEDGVLEGIISMTDYATALDSMTAFGNRQTEEANRQIWQTLLAEDVMTEQMTTLHLDSHLDAALAIFKENRFHCIPVVDKSGKLEGILTTYDIMIALINPANNTSFSITNTSSPQSNWSDLKDGEDSDEGFDGK